MKDNFKIRTGIDTEIAKDFIENDRYKKMMYRWGPGSILNLLKWYEFIEYYEGCRLIIQTIEDHNTLAAGTSLQINMDSLKEKR